MVTVMDFSKANEIAAFEIVEDVDFCSKGGEWVKGKSGGI